MSRYLPLGTLQRLLSSRVPLFPNAALGVVTINGHVISEGDVITEFGQLVVNTGDFSPENIRVYNDDIEWTPVQSYGKVMEFSLFSNGAFSIKDINGKPLFSFSVLQVGQFSIKAIRDIQRNPWSLDLPGLPFSEYTYWQITTRISGRNYAFIESTGQDISKLALSSIEGVDIRKRNLPDLPNTIIGISFEFGSVSPGTPVSIFLGDVLVIYHPNKA